MAFRTTTALFSKASRLPLTGKQAGKDFYKGTGTLPGFGPKRQGRHSRGSKAPYLLMPERMRSFVVPAIEQDCQLKPFVHRDAPELPADWPRAATKPEWHLGSRRGGLYGPRGFDGHYYIQLASEKARANARKALEPPKLSFGQQSMEIWNRVNEVLEKPFKGKR